MPSLGPIVVASIALAASFLATGCSSPPGKNNAQCTAAPICGDEQSQVDSCDGLNDCQEVSICGQTIFCAGGGGGGGGGISASNYDQSCEFAMDCAVIFEGDPCECKLCADGAINRSELEAYQSDLGGASCEPVACPDVECGESIRPFCVDNVCEAKPAPFSSTDGFDQTCEVDADCAGVFEGDVCADCQCPNAAINASEVERYQEQFDPDCAVPSPCDCAETLIACNDGICEVEI